MNKNVENNGSLNTNNITDEELAIDVSYREMIESMADRYEELHWPSNIDGLEPNLYVESGVAIYKPRNYYHCDNMIGDCGNMDPDELKLLYEYYIQINNLLNMYRNRLYEIQYNIEEYTLLLIIRNEPFNNGKMEMMKIRIYLEQRNNSDMRHLYVSDVSYKVSKVKIPELDKYL